MQFESQAPTYTSNRACTAARQCTGRRFENIPPTATTDRLCGYCTPSIVDSLSFTSGLQLRQPMGLALGPGNLLYVSDSYNRRLVVLGSDWSNNATVLLSSILIFSKGVHVTPSGEVFIVDNHRLWRGLGSSFSAVLGSLTAGDTSTSAYMPYDVTVDSSGNVLFTDNRNNRVQVVTPSGGFIRTLPNFTYPRGIFSNDDSVYVADYGSNRVVHLDSALEPVASWEVSQAFDIVVDSQGVVITSMSPDSSCLHFSIDGENPFLFCASDSLPIVQPRYLALDDANDLLYVSDGGRILKLSLACAAPAPTTAFAPTTAAVLPTTKILNSLCNSSLGNFVDFRFGSLNYSILDDNSTLAQFRQRVLDNLRDAGIDPTGTICGLTFTPGSINVRAFTPDEASALGVYFAVRERNGGQLTILVDDKHATADLLGVGTDPNAFVTTIDSITTFEPVTTVMPF